MFQDKMVQRVSIAAQDHFLDRCCGLLQCPETLSDGWSGAVDFSSVLSDPQWRAADRLRHHI